ncbi:unnamed protein product [Ilex paraguariensis]|uniref:Uncharacterized protein n=1 Tax=Ilex paraguariensis TaxID=185542 RepID=A0ABC8UYH9_9AQUA
MGTEVQCKSYFPIYYSMRDLNEDANSSSWPPYYGDNGQYFNGFRSRTVQNTYPSNDKDALKQKILEHEAIFKNQVYELHRLYRVQRDIMDEIKKKEQHKQQISIEISSGSSLIASQNPSEDAWKWHSPSFPLANSVYGRASMLGADIMNSPLSCTKGNITQAGRVPFQNGCTSKDCEELEPRPSKVRKKLFDLQLPADEYIDTEKGEEIQENNIADISSHPFTRNCEIGSGNNVKFILCGGGGTNYPGDSSPSDSCLRTSIGLADLNEPIRAEEASVPKSVDFLGHSASHGEIRGLDLSARKKSEFVGPPKELPRNSYHAGNNGTLNYLSVDNKSNGRGLSPNIYEAGQVKSNLTPIPQGLRQDELPIPSHATQVVLNKTHQPPGVFRTDHNREDLWRERTGHGVEISDRNRVPSNYRCMESVAASHIPNPYPFVNSSDLMNSRSHSISSWGRPISSLTQKLTSVHTFSSLNSSANLSRSPSSESHDICGDKRHGYYRSNPSVDLPTRNGFYHGSSSGSKELSVCFGYENCDGTGNLASERSINHGSEKFYKSSNLRDVTPAKDMNLNVVLSKSSSNEAVSKQDLDIVDEKRKCEDHLAVLPWLKPARTNGATDTRRDSSSVNLAFFQASSNPLSCKSETLKDPNPIFSDNAVSSVLTDHDIEAKKEIGDSLSNRKIFGFHIFDYPCASKNESSSLLSTSASFHCPPEGRIITNEGKNRVIDINVACDSPLPESGKQIAAGAVVVENAMDTKRTSLKNHIDLNSCMTEDEDILVPSVSCTSATVKIAVEIDLEAPVVLETQEDILPERGQMQHQAPLQSTEHKMKQPQDEVVRIAAEAIVAISSCDLHNQKDDNTGLSYEGSLCDSLLWFVEVVSSCADDLENKFDKETKGRDGGDVEDSFSDEIDYFEVMTLKLMETKEEDYMPEPFVSEIQQVEEGGATSLPHRTRRGQARRGRQRRDFQRDILPGLVSLSRHEVTEDLQTFGGLMRATGHPWNAGLTRRNGTRNRAARGKHRAAVDTVPYVAPSPVPTPLMQTLNNIEAGLEDISLTGWGKTTRRPRRQRCPAGNPPPVLLI